MEPNSASLSQDSPTPGSSLSFISTTTQYSTQGIARVRTPVPTQSSSIFRSSVGVAKARRPVPRISSPHLEAHHRLASHCPLTSNMATSTRWDRPGEADTQPKPVAHSKHSRSESLRALQEQMQQLSNQFQQTQRENQEYQKQIQTAVDKTSRKLAFSLPAAKPLNPAASPFNHNPTPPYRSSRPSQDYYVRSHSPDTSPPESNSAGESPPPPQTNMEWLQYMMDERRASEDKMLQMVAQLGQNHSQVDKSIPQVQPMSKDEDLTEYFELFELTQETPRKAYAATLLPLLNKQCKLLALSLSAAERASYSTIKKHLLAQADIVRSNSFGNIESLLESPGDRRQQSSSSWLGDVRLPRR